MGFGWKSRREEELLRATAQLTARTKLAEDRADHLSEALVQLSQSLAAERTKSSEVSFLRSRIQALEEKIVEHAETANARISAMLDRAAYGFVEGARREILQQPGRPIVPPPPPDGVRASPPPDLMDPITMGELTPKPLREGETRVVAEVSSPSEVPPPDFSNDPQFRELLDLYENWPSEPSRPSN